MSFSLPTPALALIVFAIAAVAIVALTIAGDPIPVEFKYAMGISLGALFGGTVPSLNVGGKTPAG